MEEKTPNVPGHDLSQQAERDRQGRAARVARINQDLLDRPREMKRQMGEQPSLRLRIAENLWDITEAAQSRSPAVTRAAILHAAGMGRASESTKRAPYYLCDQTLPPAEKAKRAKQLTHDPSGYVKLARAAAMLLDLDDRDAFLLDLFAGTRFAAEIESDLPADDPQREAWATLLQWFQRHVQAIDDECDLRRYFARQLGWGLRLKDGKFQSGGSGVEEPSAFLGWVDAGYSRRGIFRFVDWDPREVMPDDYTAWDIANYEDLVSRNAYKLPVEVHTVLVLWLVLAQESAGGRVTPCLRVRCISYINAAEDWKALDGYVQKPVQKGRLIARCWRGIATRRDQPPTQLPASLLQQVVPNGRLQPAPVREFEIDESEFVFSDMETYGYGFHAGEVTLRDHLPEVPPSLLSDNPYDKPCVILPLGEDTLSILGLPVSGYMAEWMWKEAPQDKFAGPVPSILTALPEPLADAWLTGDEEARKRIEEVAASPTPFSARTMLAALDRACQSPDHEQTPIHQLRTSARKLTAALATAIAEMEAKRDANLRKSL
jgi:hypothetical protein